MCFDAIKNKPALAIGLSVLTLGILPISYLGYRLIQWIAGTEAYAKVSDCFKKYCCCSPRQQEIANNGLKEDSSDEEERSRNYSLDSPAVSSSMKTVYERSPKDLPEESFGETRLDSPAPTVESSPRDNAREFFDDVFSGIDPSERISALSNAIFSFKLKSTKVQNFILKTLLSNGHNSSKDYYNVLDLYLHQYALGEKRTAAFEEEFGGPFFASSAEANYDRLMKIFEQGFGE
jgi:hypothetical protein